MPVRERVRAGGLFRVLAHPVQLDPAHEQLRRGMREDRDDALVRQGGPLDRGQVLEQLVSSRSDVHGGHAPGPAQQDIRSVERYAQVPGLGLEDLACKGSQRRSRSLGGFQDQLFMHPGTLTRGADIPGREVSRVTLTPATNCHSPAPGQHPQQVPLAGVTQEPRVEPLPAGQARYILGESGQQLLLLLIQRRLGEQAAGREPAVGTSSVTHAGVPDTGVRDPTLTLPSAIPAMTERHLTIFVSARATLVASWAAARLSNARWSWPIAYLDEAANQMYAAAAALKTKITRSHSM